MAAVSLVSEMALVVQSAMLTMGFTFIVLKADIIYQAKPMMASTSSGYTKPSPPEGRSSEGSLMAKGRLWRFKSVANYIATVPHRESATLRKDIAEIDASNSTRNPFSKAMREAAVAELCRRCEWPGL